MTTLNDSGGTYEAEIRALIEEKVAAIRVKDLEGATCSLAPGVLAFDLINPLQYTGSGSVKKRLQEWFDSFQGPIGYEMHELIVAAEEGVAYSHSLNKVTGTKRDGGQIEMWWRETSCYRKIDGNWLVAHTHSSVPFDMSTGKASLDLKP